MTSHNIQAETFNPIAAKTKEVIAIPLNKLHVSPFNMRAEKTRPSLRRMAQISASILPSIRKHGVENDVIVRPNNKGFEIIAGRRRFYGSLVIESETKKSGFLNCVVRRNISDAEALEISAIENLTTEKPDPITEYETYAGLIRLGRTPGEIATTFGVDKKDVVRRLAIAGLMPQIRDLYRDAKISTDILHALTLASKSKQREWLKLREQKKAPSGDYLKDWLLGGDAISTKYALFDLATYPGETIKDLFDGDTYFAVSSDFWIQQDQSIAAKRDAYLADQWAEVVVQDRGHQFANWEFGKAKKKDGARVYIEVRASGEVVFHEGYLSLREITKKKAKDEKAKTGNKAEAEGGEAPSRSPVTQAMQSYLDQHRLAVVRLAVIARPTDALRLMIAHAIAASGNWQVAPDPQHVFHKPVQDSLAASPAQAAFAAEAKKVRALLAPAFKDRDDMEDEEAERIEVSGRSNRNADLTFKVFQRLLKLKDAEVVRIAALVMAETMAAGSAVVDGFGTFAKVETRQHWSPDATFFELLRDRTAINGMVAELDGKKAADKMLTAKVKEQKAHLATISAKAPAWCPGWMAFPATGL